jgi:hypothetical protein
LDASYLEKLIDMKKLFPLICVAALGFTSVMATPKVPVLVHRAIVSDDDRQVSDFKGIAAGGPIDVVVKMGNTESLRFEGDADAIATLVSEVKSGVLIIRPQTSWKSWSKKYEGMKITAYVTAKRINSLTMSGNGSLSVSGTLGESNLATTLSGSGNITANVNVSELTGVISGSGSLNINGKARSADVTISGSGRLAGKSLTVERLNTTISGSGMVNINAQQTIDAVISGSGHVIYSGNASVNKTVIGSGGVSKI